MFVRIRKYHTLQFSQEDCKLDFCFGMSCSPQEKQEAFVFVVVIIRYCLRSK